MNGRLIGGIYCVVFAGISYYGFTGGVVPSLFVGIFGVACCTVCVLYVASTIGK